MSSVPRLKSRKVKAIRPPPGCQLGRLAKPLGLQKKSAALGSLPVASMKKRAPPVPYTIRLPSGDHAAPSNLKLEAARFFRCVPSASITDRKNVWLELEPDAV